MDHITLATMLTTPGNCIGCGRHQATQKDAADLFLLHRAPGTADTARYDAMCWQELDGRPCNDVNVIRVLHSLLNDFHDQVRRKRSGRARASEHIAKLNQQIKTLEFELRTTKQALAEATK